MEDKIFEEIKEQNRQSMEYYLKELEIIDDENEITLGGWNENYDMLTILSNLGLIEKSMENLKILDDFYEYLTKLGIETGVGNGKRLMIDAIQMGKIDFEKIMEIDPKSYVNHNIEPKFISDMKEAIFNGK